MSRTKQLSFTTYCWSMLSVYKFEGEQVKRVTGIAGCWGLVGIEVTAVQTDSLAGH